MMVGTIMIARIMPGGEIADPERGPPEEREKTRDAPRQGSTDSRSQGTSDEIPQRP